MGFLPRGEYLTHFIRFFVTNCVGLALDCGITAAAVYDGISPYVALVLGMVVGSVAGFLLLTYWVFPTDAGRFSARRIGGFVLGVVLIYAVRAAWVWGWQRLPFGGDTIFLGLFLAYGVSFMTNFCFQKFAVFAQTKK